MIDLSREGPVFVLCMRAGENRIGGAFLDEFARALDEIEAADGDRALVTTGDGRFYSNGLDVASLARSEAAEVRRVLSGLHALFGRLLAFPAPTVAALNGHAFAAGAMLALCQDFRVMRSGRGYFCLPEIDMATGQPLTDGMFALLRARLDRAVFHDLLVTGRRSTAEEAVAAEIVNEAREESEVLPRAIALAESLAGKDGATLAALKRGLYGPALETLARS